ncbi:pyrroloquinoline quinone precursor peptide PqqA [Gilvimarinus sp. DZF01]
MMHRRTGALSMWTKPAYNKIRLGFEITMYFQQR